MCSSCDNIQQIEVEVAITNLMQTYDPQFVRETIMAYDFDNWRKYVDTSSDYPHAVWCSYMITAFGECDCLKTLP